MATGSPDVAVAATGKLDPYCADAGAAVVTLIVCRPTTSVVVLVSVASATAFTVTPYVPGGVLPVVVIVSVEDAATSTGLGLNDADVPVGKAPTMLRVRPRAPFPFDVNVS